jgi:hypothetical protein
MKIKAAKNLVKISALLGFVALGSVSFNAAAAVITFGTGGAGFGGDISLFLTPGGGEVQGTDINIGALTIAGTSADGSYTVTNGVLSFNTLTNILDIQGSIAGLGIVNQTLLSGTTGDFSYAYNSASNLNFFDASGSSTLSANLLSAVGLDLGTEFDYFGYTIDSNQLGEVINAGVINTSSASVVPIPAAAWLFISAIAGLTGAKRMSSSKRTA